MVTASDCTVESLVAWNGMEKYCKGMQNIINAMNVKQMYQETSENSVLFWRLIQKEEKNIII